MVHVHSYGTVLPADVSPFLVLPPLILQLVGVSLSTWLKYSLVLHMKYMITLARYLTHKHIIMVKTYYCKSF